MTLTLSKARAQVETRLADDSLQLLIDAVEADIMRLGGVAYPMRFSGALLDIAIVSAPDADSDLERDFFGGFPAIGNPLIDMTKTAVVEVSYTLAALDAGAVTVSIDGDSRDDGETLSSLANGTLEDLSFYLVSHGGRIELAFEEAEDADSAMQDRVTWQVAMARRDAARTLLTEVGRDERVRFVIARAYAGLRMAVADWQAALDRVAVSCLRVAVTDEGVASYMEQGGDARQALEYLSYSDEYRSRLNQVLDLTGGWFI